MKIIIFNFLFIVFIDIVKQISIMFVLYLFIFLFLQNMKFLKKLFGFIIFLVIVVLLIYFYFYLQKKEVIVLNNTKSIMIRLSAVSKLETAEMEFAMTWSWEDYSNPDFFESLTIDDQIYEFLFKDKMEIDLEWRVVAWIDLKKIATWDIITNLDWSVSIKMPEAEILYVKIDSNDVPDREVWIGKRIFWWWNANMETNIRQSAEEKMVKEAIEKWILEAATKNAHEALAGLLQEMNIRLSDGNIFENIMDNDSQDNSTWNSYEI